MFRLPEQPQWRTDMAQSREQEREGEKTEYPVVSAAILRDFFSCQTSREKHVRGLQWKNKQKKSRDHGGKYINI